MEYVDSFEKFGESSRLLCYISTDGDEVAALLEAAGFKEDEGYRGARQSDDDESGMSRSVILRANGLTVDSCSLYDQRADEKSKSVGFNVMSRALIFSHSPAALQKSIGSFVHTLSAADQNMLFVNESHSRAYRIISLHY